MRQFIKQTNAPFRIGVFTFQDPVLLCSLLYLLLMRDYSGFLRISLLASVGHECGHIVCYWMFCGQLPEIHVCATGLCMRTPFGALDARERFLLALAGPMTNFLLAGITLILLNVHFTLVCAAFLSANILLGLFNLLPIPPLDGFVVSAFLYAICLKRCFSG